MPLQVLNDAIKIWKDMVALVAPALAPLVLSTQWFLRKNDENIEFSDSGFGGSYFINNSIVVLSLLRRPDAIWGFFYLDFSVLLL